MALGRLGALLWQPPHAFHRIYGPGARKLSRDAFEGVHTTPSEASLPWAPHQVAYPVVLGLDTAGLEARLDADAELLLPDLEDSRKEYGEILEKHDWELQDANDYLDYGPHESELWVGDDIADFIVENNRTNVIAATLANYGYEEATAVLQHWVAGGALPARVVDEMVSQFRYRENFEIDRLISVSTFCPIWREFLDGYSDRRKVKRLETAGWTVFTIEDIDMRVSGIHLWGKKARPDQRLEYHGTASVIAKSAFPQISIPVDPPCPIREVDEDEDEDEDEDD